uniref:Uncharacterized protein n=1 Tax=Myotis myotis TaxID=51298 RepID=A0A7J7ZY51_MYOMY|nr:hypothetical protein mMyoMyo1_009572 [Myotis myotis]
MSTSAELFPAPWVVTLFSCGTRTGCSPLPRTPEPRRRHILGGGRPGSGREGKGFSCRPDLDPRPAPGRISHPREGFLSVICLPETIKTARRDGVVAPVTSARLPGQAPAPRPLHCSGGVPGGPGAPNPHCLLPPGPAPPPARSPIKALSDARPRSLHSRSPPPPSSPSRGNGAAATAEREGQAGALRATLVPTVRPSRWLASLPALPTPQETKPGPLHTPAPAPARGDTNRQLFLIDLIPQPRPTQAERQPSHFLTPPRAPRRASALSSPQGAGGAGWRCYAGPCQRRT